MGSMGHEGSGRGSRSSGHSSHRRGSLWTRGWERILTGFKREGIECGRKDALALLQGHDAQPRDAGGIALGRTRYRPVWRATSAVDDRGSLRPSHQRLQVPHPDGPGSVEPLRHGRATTSESRSCSRLLSGRCEADPRCRARHPDRSARPGHRADVRGLRQGAGHDGTGGIVVAGGSHWTINRRICSSSVRTGCSGSCAARPAASRMRRSRSGSTSSSAASSASWRGCLFDHQRSVSSMARLRRNLRKEG
jgi:hypothetical protein